MRSRNRKTKGLPKESDLEIAPLNGRLLQIRRESKDCYALEICDGRTIVTCYSPKTYSLHRGDIVSVSLKEINSKPIVNHLEIHTRAERQLPSLDEMTRLGPEFRIKHHEASMILDGTKKVFEQRSKILSFIRTFLEDRGFLEVETPSLQSVPEIAPVPDFVTEQPRCFKPFHLRITNTEYMRRLLVAGFEKIYQMGKCFRDESPSFKHHPEFTQLTFGVANHTYDYLIDLIETLIFEAAMNVIGRSKISFKGNQIDLTPPWERKTMRDAILEYVGIDIEKYPLDEDLADAMKERGIDLPSDFGFSGFLVRNALIDRMVEDFVVPEMIRPVFIREYPYCLGGPAKEIEGRLAYKQRCETYIGTMEVANVSTPQNDYRKLKKWYVETLQQKIETGWRNQELDDDYLYAMSLGIPLCTTGGLGIDRLVMLLLEKSDIREVTLFPWKKAKDAIE